MSWLHVVPVGSDCSALRGLVIETTGWHVFAASLQVSVRGWRRRNVPVDFGRRMVYCRPMYCASLFWLRGGRWHFWSGVEAVE